MRRYGWMVAGLVVWVVATALPAASMDLPAGYDRLVADDSRTGDWFGYSVAVDGHRIVVGAPFDHIGKRWLGTVWVFSRSGLGWHAEQIKPEQEWRRGGGVYGGRRFGYSVDIAGDRIVVGAPNAWINGVETGGLFVYDLVDGEWVETILEPEGLDPRDGLGWRVAISEDGARILAGTMKSAPGFGRPGKAFLYDLVGGEWNVHMFQPSDGADGDEFGAAIGLGDDFVIIGSPLHDSGARYSGAAYLYHPTDDGWAETKVVPDEPAYDMQFGRSLGVFESEIVVWTGTDGELNLLNEGPDGWTIEPRHVSHLDEFAVDPDLVVPEDALVRDRLMWSEFDGLLSNRAPGTVRRLWWNGDAWIEYERLEGTDFGEGNGFGAAMALDGDVVVIAAPWHRVGTPNWGDQTAGVVYTTGMPPRCGSWEPTIVGTNGDDEFFGTPGDDVVITGEGNDVIHPSGGRDVYCLSGDHQRLTGPIHATRHEIDGLTILETVVTLDERFMLVAS